MCLSAIYWSHIDMIFYGNTRQDASDIGFDDNFIYEEFNKEYNSRKIPIMQKMEKEAMKAFTMWNNKTDKIEY